VSARRGRSRRNRHIVSVAHVKSQRQGPIIWAIILLFLLAGVLASANTARGSDILTAVQRFMLFYSGVLALVALTAAVGVGVVAADRIVMTPAGRVVAQAVHRAVSFAALAFLVTHIVLEIFAHRSHVIDAFVPFLAHGRTFYIGLGTIASDLVVLLIVTGIARGRFAAKWPWTWRAIHATAYLAWPLAMVHGLLAGRTAKPYVDWSYGACLAAVGLALVIRLVATLRGRRETTAYPVPDRVPSPIPAVMPAMTPGEYRDVRAFAPRAGRAPRALPPGTGSGPATPYAQAPYSGAPYPRAPYPQAPYSQAPYLEAHRPSDLHPDHPSGPWQYPPSEPEQEPEPSAVPPCPETDEP
jgi:hypothetical protein